MLEKDYKQYWKQTTHGTTEILQIEGCRLGIVKQKSVVQGVEKPYEGFCNLNGKKAEAKTRDALKRWVEQEVKKTIELLASKL